MALSGTTLTVTTLTTTGLLTNNTSGQISSVTGSSLASLLGGSPTFAGMTLSGLSNGVLKVTSGVIGLAANSDYQYPITYGTNINITGTNNNIISVVASPSFTGVTLSAGPLANTMLKTISGVISAATAYTDYTPALTATGNVIINTGTGVINTVTNPTFAGIYCSSVGTNNTLLGTGAGAALSTSGTGGNTLTGYQAGVLINSGLTNACYGHSSGAAITTGSSNACYGYSSGAAITTGSNIVCIGYNSGSVLATGSNGLYIGNGSAASSSSVSNEGVINVSGLTATGKGANTLYINANAGLYGYIPSYWYGYAQYQVGGVVGWVKYSSKNMDLRSGDNTQLLIPSSGLYEFNVSGSLYSSGGTQNANMNVNGSVYLGGPIYYTNSGWQSVSLSAVVVVTGTTTYISYTLGGGLQTSLSAPMILTAKFISL